ncbi:hypothetical protein ANN_08254 [Periplaneta americana]|uniref:Uncharacterized protein n=1 Tax=Periplaneta americana TaxID=6978 RepID=A0ABQ8T2I2_PERAM|nr:hypothetical protein ANN_08254 [Periplaneta americana]
MATKWTWGDMWQDYTRQDGPMQSRCGTPTSEREDREDHGSNGLTCLPERRGNNACKQTTTVDATIHVVACTFSGPVVTRLLPMGNCKGQCVPEHSDTRRHSATHSTDLCKCQVIYAESSASSRQILSTLNNLVIDTASLNNHVKQNTTEPLNPRSERYSIASVVFEAVIFRYSSLTPIFAEPGDIARQACFAKVNHFPYKIGKTTFQNMHCGLLTPGVTSYELQLDIYALAFRLTGCHTTISTHCTSRKFLDVNFLLDILGTDIRCHTCRPSTFPKQFFNLVSEAPTEEVLQFSDYVLKKTKFLMTNTIVPLPRPQCGQSLRIKYLLSQQMVLKLQ